MMNSRLNLNGSTATALGNQQQAVTDAARNLIDALRDSLPHGRDYQTVPNPAAALDADRAVWGDEMNAVKESEEASIQRHLHMPNQCEADRLARARSGPAMT